MTAIKKAFTVNKLAVNDSAVISGLLYPTADGTDGQVLTTNGDGQLTFTTVSGGSGGGVTNLSDLDDVIVTGLEQGGILQYDSAQQQWVVSNNITEEQQDLTSDGGFY